MTNDPHDGYKELGKLVADLESLNDDWWYVYSWSNNYDLTTKKNREDNRQRAFEIEMEMRGLILKYIRRDKNES